jgi:hypothetical protein
MPKVIVLIADQDDPKHGEVAVLDSTVEAERLVEVLLEAGTRAGRIRIFSGAELEAHVVQKPRVELVECEWVEPVAAPVLEFSPATNGDPWPASAAEEAPAEEEPAQDEPLAEDEAAEDASEQEEAPEPDEEPRQTVPALALLHGLPVRSVELMPELKH